MRKLSAHAVAYRKVPTITAACQCTETKGEEAVVDRGSS